MSQTNREVYLDFFIKGNINELEENSITDTVKSINDSGNIMFEDTKDNNTWVRVSLSSCRDKVEIPNKIIQRLQEKEYTFVHNQQQ